MDSFTDKYGIADARIKAASQTNDPEKYRAVAVNGREEEAWVPVTNTSINQGQPPNFTCTAWREEWSEPGITRDVQFLGYTSVITLFRIRGGFLECFVPGNTKYFVGIGVVGY